MTPTPDDRTALRRLLERLRHEQRDGEDIFTGRVVNGEPVTRRRRSAIAREADALVPLIERLTNPESCVWRWYDRSCYYESQCGEAYCFMGDDDLDAQHYRFCPGCGKPIKAERVLQEDEL